MKTEPLPALAAKLALVVLFVLCVSPSFAQRPVPRPVTPQSTNANFKPAPKRPTAEDVQRLLNSKSPKPPVCNAVSAKCNPIPRLSALNPSANIAPGSAPFTLVVTGGDFVPGAVVQWDYNPLATTYVNSGQLTAVVTADLLASPNVANIAVLNPIPGGGTSASLSLTIGDNPPPSFFFIYPSFVPVGTGDTTLYFSGSGFTDQSVVTWNGQNLPTAFYDNTFISAVVSAAGLAKPGAAELSVFTPSPGGGSIPPELFPITVPLQTNDLAYDPQSGKLLASVPGAAGISGNSLRFIDPNTGVVSSAYFVGSEPNRVVLSDDGQFAYTGLVGSPSVIRFNLKSLVPDLNFSLGLSTTFGENIGPNYARDIAVVPGQPHSVVVSLRSVEIDPNSTGIAAFDDGVPRANSTSFYSGSLAFAGSPSQFFAYDNGWYSLGRYQLDPSGVTLLDSTNYGPFSALTPCISYSASRLYGCDGTIVDAASEAPLGSYPLPNGASQFNSVVPNAAPGASALLAQDFSLNAYLSTYDQSSFQQLSAFRLTGISFPNFVDFNQPFVTSLIHWGTDGLAFRDIGGQIYFFHSKALFTQGNPVPAANILSPAGSPAGAPPLVLDVQGSNFVAGSIVTWNGVLKPTTFISNSELQAQLGAADLALPGIAAVAVNSPAPGGGLSASLFFTVGNNPVPQLETVSPTTIAANGPSFTLSVTGRGFVPGSTIAWNGYPVSTVYDNSGHLHAPMFSPSTKGPSAVTVINPAPGGGVSNKLIVNATHNNPVPFIFSISPESAPMGSSTLGVTISGYNFTIDTIAYWNGAPLGTNYLSPYQLAVTVPASLLARLATGHVTVSNPLPGGGSSGELLFPVYLSLPFAEDMVYEPFTRKAYLAMADYHGTGPALLSVDPATGAQGNPISLPGNPVVLALSDDRQFLYIGFNPQPLIARFNLSTQSVDLQFSPACIPFSLAVMPQHPRTIAAVCNGVTAIYDDGVMRPVTANVTGILAFASASSLFENAGGEPGSNIYRLAVDANGVTLAASGNGAAPPFFSLGLATGFGRVITPDGQVIDENSLQVLASLSGQNPDQLITVAPDESVGRIFGGSHTFFGFVNQTAYAFDPYHYQPLAALSIPGPYGAVSVLPRLLRWGQDGVIFQGEAGLFGQVSLYSVQSPSFVLPQPSSPNPVPALSSLSPAKVSPRSPNLRLHVHGNNFARGAVALLDGQLRETFYVSPTELVADLPAADLRASGTAQISVANPAPGGGHSQPLDFQIQ